MVKPQTEHLSARCASFKGEKQALMERTHEKQKHPPQKEKKEKNINRNNHQKNKSIHNKKI